MESASMHLVWLSLTGVRSYQSLEWRPDPSVNILVGGNGAGKTNVLEALSYLASLRSFRGAPEAVLVAYESESSVIRGEVASGDASSLIEVEIRRKGGRKALVNRQRLPRSSDLLGHVRVVTFLPEDLDIVKRGPAGRRDFLDAVAVQLWPGSYLDQAEFERALRQRNSFLKQGGDDAVTLGVWDERLAQAGGKVLARRARAAAALSGWIAQSYRGIAATTEALEVEYRSDWATGFDALLTAAEHAQALAGALADRRRIDRDRRMTTVGPHRDEPVMLLDGRDLRHHGSQGEQRTAALSLRLASHRAVEEAAGVSPILLLDDVFSELDPDRAAALTVALPEAQTFVTTAHPADVPMDGKVWSVADGTIR